MWGRRMHVGLWWESHKEGYYWDDQDVDGWIILKSILQREVGMVLAGVIWIRIGTNGGLL
jgi:hypothetical protein